MSETAYEYMRKLQVVYRGDLDGLAKAAGRYIARIENSRLALADTVVWGTGLKAWVMANEILENAGLSAACGEWKRVGVIWEWKDGPEYIDGQQWYVRWYSGTEEWTGTLGAMDNPQNWPGLIEAYWSVPHNPTPRPEIPRYTRDATLSGSTTTQKGS